MREAALHKVTATIDGKKREITKLEAAAMQLATKGASGDPVAMGKFLAWCDEMQSRASAARPVEFPFSAADVEVLKEIYQRMQQCLPPEAGA